MVPVLLVTGPIGVGKTAVLREADTLLTESGTRHATVELEEIARCWPHAIEDSRTTFAYQNLAVLWSNFVAVGASRLLLSALVEQRSDLRLVSEAIPGAAITVVRLHASLSTLEQRIRRREPAAPDDELVGARWWMQHFTEVQVEDYVVETENRSVREIARDVLRLAHWLP
jgi:chloramphenicol 3-O-phosphotransferase